MQIRSIKRAAIVVPMALVLTFATGAIVQETDPGRAQAQTSVAHRPLSRLALANAHVQYLYLDEVVAGRSGLMTPAVYLARAHLEYLLLPEVMHHYSWLADAH